MAFFDEAIRGKIVIKRMVFHLIGSEEVGLVLLQETKPGKFADFFLERIWSVNGGTPYVFSDASSTRTRLARIVNNGNYSRRKARSSLQIFRSFMAAVQLLAPFSYSSSKLMASAALPC